MDNTRTGQREAPTWRSTPATTPFATSWPMPRAGARAWLSTNLLAVAAIGAAFWTSVAAPLLVAWASFAVLNVLLQLAREAAPQRAERATLARRNSRSSALLLGLSWGAAVVLLLPYATPTSAGVLLAVALGVALFAIPVCNEEGETYAWFATPLAGLAVFALAVDARYRLALPWAGLATAILFVNATAYYRPLADLRRALRGAADRARPALTPVADTAATPDATTPAAIDAGAGDARSRHVLDTLGDAVLTTDADGHIDYLNPLAEVLLGVSLAQARGQAIERCLHLSTGSDEHNRARALFDSVRRHARVQFGSDDSALRRRDGIVYGVDYVVTALRDAQGDFAGANVVLRDVTEKRHRAETMVWHATHDALTGTINRAEFERRLEKLLERSSTGTAPIHTLLFIDVDHFKFVNDSYGHAAGDLALTQLAELLRSRIRGADTLARVGGDEFAALLYSCGTDKARLIAEGLRAAVERHAFRWNAIDLPVSISIGIVEFDRRASCTSEIMHAADSACYGAKAVGRNRVRCFTAREASAAGEDRRDFSLVKEVQGALHGNRLQLFYQPVRETQPERPARCCELSAGVRRADGSLMQHDELAVVARRFQLSAELDRWVVKATLDNLRLGHPALKDMDLVLIPLTQQAVVDERVQQFVLEQLDEHAEFAERVGFVLQDCDDSASVRVFAARLKQQGCAIMVEDAGYGSRGIELVKSLGADFLGIRASLVQNIARSAVDYEAVLGLSRIARSLGMRTIAEHVDNEELRATLAAMGVDLVKDRSAGGPHPVSLHAVRG